MLLLRGATCNQAGQPGRNKFQYMLLLRGATDALQRLDGEFDVSIHAPLARSNLLESDRDKVAFRFNTCSSCEEQHARRLTRRHHGIVSIHAPLARSNAAGDKAVAETIVSIHAPLARSNSLKRVRNALTNWFQYMLLLRGATFSDPDPVRRRLQVSIHAPLARSNTPPSLISSWTTTFQYMLLLRGATSSTPLSRPGTPSFQYMLLLRGATRTAHLQLRQG